MEKELIENYDLSTYLGDIGVQVLLKGEVLVEFGNSWQKGEFEESASIIRALGRELTQIGQELELARNQLCQTCALKNVRKSTSFEE